MQGLQRSCALDITVPGGPLLQGTLWSTVNSLERNLLLHFSHLYFPSIIVLLPKSSFLSSLVNNLLGSVLILFTAARIISSISLAWSVIFASSLFKYFWTALLILSFLLCHIVLSFKYFCAKEKKISNLLNFSKIAATKLIYLLTFLWSGWKVFFWFSFTYFWTDDSLLSVPFKIKIFFKTSYWFFPLWFAPKIFDIFLSSLTYWLSSER